VHCSKERLMILLLASLVTALITSVAPLPFSPNMDLSTTYITNYSVLHGNTIYGPLEKIGDLPSSVIIDRQPLAYPPWHYTLLLPLSLFTPHTAARIWGSINILFVFFAVYLLTPRISPRQMALTLVAVLLTAPIQGHLAVGQFTLILLLACALALRLEESGKFSLLGIVLALLTIKPHVGLPVCAGIFIWLWVHRRRHLFAALASWLTTIALLFLYSLLIDPTIPHYYFFSVNSLNSHPVNIVCDSCSSLTLAIQSLLDHGLGSPWRTRFILGAALGVTLLYPFIRQASSFPVFMSGLVCSTILSAPYVRSYDYVLISLPILAILIDRPYQLPSRRLNNLATACFATAALMAGLLPYFTTRDHHRNFLWISAALAYAGCLFFRNLSPQIAQPHSED
jgi:hypothetical protein